MKNTIDANNIQGLFLGEDPIESPKRQNPIEADPITEVETFEDPATEDIVENPIEAEHVEYETSFDEPPIVIIAKDWKEQGRLPEDFEIKEDLTPEEFEAAYREHLKTNSESEIRSEIVKSLKEEYGLTDDFLQEQKVLRASIDPEEVRTMDLYYRLASIELDPQEESFSDYVRDLHRYYYIDKEFSQDEAIKFADRDMEEIEHDTEAALQKVEKIQAYFSKRGADKKDAIEAHENKLKKDRKDKIEKFHSDIQTRLDSGLINNKQYSKEQMDMVKRAFFDKTEVLVNERGERERVTMFEKKTREYKTNIDLYVDHLVTFVLGSDVQPKKVNPAQDVRQTLKKLNQSVQVKVKGKTVPVSDTDIVGVEIA